MRAHRLFIFIGLAASFGCGGGGAEAPSPEVGQEPDPADTTSGGEADADDGMEVTGITGTYGHDVVAAVQSENEPAVLSCYGTALRDAPYAFGRVVLAIHVGVDGRVRSAHVAESDLGHAGAERCMVDRVRRADFPPPQGNAEADVRFSFELAPPGRPANAGSADRLAGAVEANREAVEACTGGRSGFTLTAYVDARGAVRSAGVSVPDADAAQVTECLVNAARGWTASEGGSWYAKVSVAL